MMLDHLGEREGADLVRRAVTESLSSGRLTIGEYGQPAGGTRRAGAAIAESVLTLV